MSNEEIRLDRVTRELAKRCDVLGDDVGGLLARMDLVESAMRAWTSARESRRPTPYGLGDDMQAEDAAASRIASWLERLHDELTKNGARQEYLEALSDMAIDIRNGEWRCVPTVPKEHES